MIESIKICPFKAFREQCFDKEPSCPFFFSLLHVKNCVLYIDISVEFAFNSSVEISKFFLNFVKVETQQKMTDTRFQNGQQKTFMAKGDGREVGFQDGGYFS